MGELTVNHHEIGRARASTAALDAETLFVFAHPSRSSLDSFLAESLVWHGAGFIGIDCRYVAEGDDDFVLRSALEDVAGALTALLPDGRRVVLVGQSGGAPFMAALEARYRFGEALVLLAPYVSRAERLARWIDPAVRDDGSRDPNLDLYAPGRTPPLARSFVERYRAAQWARIASLAEEAASHLRSGNPTAKLQIPHLCADPAFIDRSLDPNQRGACPLGEPANVNRQSGLLADGTTARAFFEQWYQPTCSADLRHLLPHLDMPVLSVAFGADALVMPSETSRVATALPRGSTLWTLDGARHDPSHQPDHVDALARKMLAWFDHLPSRA